MAFERFDRSNKIRRSRMPICERDWVVIDSATQMTPFPDHPEIHLLSEGAVIASDCGTLVVADVHLGKSATFRARGLAVPEGDMMKDFARLLSLVMKYKARRLVIAGDFFHAPAGITPELEDALGKFMLDLAVPLVLVAGNHDRKLKRLPLEMRAVPALMLAGGVRVIHDPADAVAGLLNLAGHWHPVVRIRDGSQRPLRMQSFMLRSQTLILPAFGSFTGGTIIACERGDRVFVALQDSIIELPRTFIR